MHLVSFYKDWSNQKPPDPNCDARRLLAVRRVHFCGAAEARVDARWRVDAQVAVEAAGRVEVPHLPAAQAKVHTLFERRFEELERQRLWSDGDAFLAYARQVIGEE